MEHIWRNVDLVSLKIILESFGSLVIFPKLWFQSATSCTLRILFEPNFLQVFVLTVNIKSCFLEFWNLKIKIFEKDWKLTLWPKMGNWENPNIFEIANRRPKRSECSDSGTSETYMGYLCPCNVQAHLGSFGALAIFRKMDFFTTLLLLRLRFFFSQTFYIWSLWQSTH